MKDAHCPKCKSGNVQAKTSSGGPAIYKRLACIDCGFQGGSSRVYENEAARVDREIRSRFVENGRDACKEFIDGVLGQ